MNFSRLGSAVLATVVATLVMAQPAAAQSQGSNVQQEIINSVIQNIIQNVRDQIHRRTLTPPPGALRFSAEESEFDNRNPFAAQGSINPFSALAYAKAPALAPSPLSVWLFGANLVGSGDKSSTIFNSIQTTTATGAFDVTKIGIFTATDALTFIGTGSDSWAHQLMAGPISLDSSTPSTSGTLSYLNGGFSADFTALASWTSNSVTSPFVFVIPDSSSIGYTGNAQYRFDFPYSVWIEPTAGVTYTEVYTANFGTKLLDTTEVHGGARIGTEMKWMGFTVEPTLSGAVFQVVAWNASTVPLGLLVPAAAAAPPPGLLGGRGSGKINVIWTQNFSSYIEVHGSGTAGTKTIPFVGATQTIGAQAGLRYSWN
jgi:hypothetical protein